MSTTETAQQDTAEPTGAPSAPSAGSSVLDVVRRIRAEREQADPRLLKLLVPGYENRLAIIYRFPEDGIERVLRASEAGMAADTGLEKVEAAADLLIACAGAVVGVDEAEKPLDLLTGEPIPDKTLPENPLRLERRFGEQLGIAIPPEVKRINRHVTRHLFSPMAMLTGRYEGDFALISTSRMVFGWLNGAELDVEESTLGE